MAIGYDTAVNAGYSGSTSTTKTWSHTCSGSNRFLVVQILTNLDRVTGVTYNGVAMTLIYKGATDNYSTVYGLIAPATGANDIVVTCSTSQDIIAHSISYTGVSQSIFPSNSAQATSSTVNVVTVYNNSWLVSFYRHTSVGSATAGANTTLRIDDATYAMASADSNAALTPPGTFGQTITGAGTDYMKAFELIDAAAGPSTTIKTWNGIARANLKTLNGVASANIKTINGIT